MKKILLSTALAASTLLPTTHAESFSGFFASGKGAFLFLNKAKLPDLSKNDLTADTKDYGDFGAHGGSIGAELGYSFRFANNFVVGVSLGGGYLHHSIKESINTDEGEDRNRLGLDFLNSSLYTEARLRLGMVFRRFHIFLNPGLSVNMTNPERTLHYPGTGSDKPSVKIAYKSDKEPEWKERLDFVINLNVEYAITQTLFVGGNIGFRYGFADVKNMADAIQDDVKKDRPITDLAYKNPYGMEVGVTVGASF